MITGGIAAILSYLVGWAVNRALLRYGVIDSPNGRSSHSRPTARGGGLAIMVVLVPIAAIVGFQADSRIVLGGLLGAATALAAVSFVDDIRSLRASVRLGCHALAAVAILAVLKWPQIHIGLDTARETMVMPAWLVLSFAFLWIVGYTNAFNFMDGINGIAVGQAVITGAGTALLGGLALNDFGSVPISVSFVVAGSAVGFMPHNFPQARMFMGDVGSIPLGFLLASLTLWLAKTAGSWLLVPLVLLHANFVLDTGLTFSRRMLRGEPLLQAHREHFYQRLVQAGKSHSFVTTVEMGLQVLVTSLLIVYIHAARQRALIAISVVLIWLSFFAYVELCYRRRQRALAIKSDHGFAD